MTVKALRLRWLVVAAVLLAGGGAQAANPYEVIVKRNAFGLKPVQEEKVPTQIEVPAPQANIVLTGMAVFEGEKQAFLSVTQVGEKETKYLNLAEHEREEGIEVVEIDLKHDQVRIKYKGENSVLTFPAHDTKTAATPQSPTRMRR